MIDRVHKRKLPAGAEIICREVAVLIPAYNEGKVIVRTIRSVMRSNYPKLRVIVIDDGSTDNTLEVARDGDPAEIGVRQTAGGDASQTAARRRR